MELGNLGDYLSEKQCEPETGSIERLNKGGGVREKLLREARRLSDRLQEINEALSLLERNPDIERLINIIR